MRPIGKRIREACQIMEEHGSMNYKQVQQLMDDVELSNARKYCVRAVYHGLATVDKSVRPNLFSVVDNWREVANLKTKKKVQAPKPFEKKHQIINSVFQLGSLYAP